MSAPRNSNPPGCRMHESATPANGRSVKRRHLRRMRAAFFSSSACAVLAVLLASPSAADPTADLTSAVDAARRECPALRSDPVLEALAQRQNEEANSYLQHTARFIPFQDPLPLMREMGSNAGQAKLLLGYGDTGIAPGTLSEKAIRGALLQGWAAIPDCTYTRYGANVLENGSNGYSLAAVVMASE